MGASTGERRLRTIRDLVDGVATEPSSVDVLRAAARALEKNPEDIAFAALFLVSDDQTPTLRATTGPIASYDGWPFETASSGGTLVDDVMERLGAVGVPGQPVERSILFEIDGGGSVGPAGFLVCGLNPSIPFDAEYRTFLALCARQIGAALSHAPDRRRPSGPSVRSTIEHADRLALLADVAAQLGRARSIESARQIVGRSGGSLAGAAVTVELAGEKRQQIDGDATFELEGSDGALLGRLTASRGGRAAFSAEDRAVLVQLAQLVGAKLDSLRLFEREHRLAATLQASMILETLPEVPGLLLAAHYSTGSSEAAVGGDWYDAIALPGGFLAIAVGDVVGRGVQAAAVMGQVRNAFRAFLLEGYTPAEALDHLNGLANRVGEDYFCTLACLVVDPTRGFGRLASAGHVPPLVVSCDGTVRWPGLTSTIAIGAVDEVVYSDTALMLHPGDTLLLYTDGLVERRHRPLDEGFSLLAGAARECGGDPSVLVEHVVNQMMRTGIPTDDVAAIALTAVPSPAQPLMLRLPAKPGFLAGLRRRLRERFQTLGLNEDEIFDLVVAVNEAAANAIEHARDPTSPTIEVSVTTHEQRILISVRDHGSWKVAPSAEDRGRGLQLIKALAGTPSIERSPSGTTTTIRGSLPRGRR